MWQNSNWDSTKNLNCEKTQKFYKTQSVTKPKNTNCDKAQKLKLGKKQYWEKTDRKKTKIVTKLIEEKNCDKTQKLKFKFKL